MPVLEKRLAKLDKIPLKRGAHETLKDGACAMELVSWLAGKSWTDHPECVSPVIGAFCRNWNDSLNDHDRQLLKPYLPRLIDTASDETTELRRSWMAMDWLTRKCAPAFLELTPSLKIHADTLRALPEITDKAMLDNALTPLAAAWDAAWAAAWEAAGAAAGKTLAPVVNTLQASAFRLLERMIAA